MFINRRGLSCHALPISLESRLLTLKLVTLEAILEIFEDAVRVGTVGGEKRESDGRWMRFLVALVRWSIRDLVPQNSTK